jgi:hypothetical protein
MKINFFTDIQRMERDALHGICLMCGLGQDTTDGCGTWKYNDGQYTAQEKKAIEKVQHINKVLCSEHLVGSRIVNTRQILKRYKICG